MSNVLEVARCADVCLCQLLLLPPFDFFLPLGKGRVHNVVHLRIVVITLNTVDLWVFDIDSRHGQCGSICRVASLLGFPLFSPH